MALSYFSDYGTYPYLNPESSDFHEITEACSGNVFPCFCDSCGNLNTLFDGFYQVQDPYFSQPPPHFPQQDQYSLFSSNLSPDFFRPDEFDYFYYRKRARTYSDFTPAAPQFNPFDGSVLNSVPAPEFFTGFAASASEFQVPVSGDTQKKKPEGGSLSVQSVAARQRRKKISDKTQELGKLIPGGNKMNTAEMFQATFNYVKFMEAQVALLQFMGSLQETEKDSGNVKGLHALICSPKIQEKLYEDGKCMVPKDLVGTLAMDQRLRSNPSISKDLHCLLQSLS
ncbi:transcription factor bHLH52-like [Aristolochia californica]|uniref:transcription factor bHLH52-like n=1 Tax=Aristolochia californica TaxID=171875 RepID=UPI0035DFDCCE